MFKFPYIDQLAPRVPPPTPRLRVSSTKNLTEYQDKISGTGEIIMKHRLHNHFKCGKEGRKCEHRILSLNDKQKKN